MRREAEEAEDMRIICLWLDQQKQMRPCLQHAIVFEIPADFSDGFRR